MRKITEISALLIAALPIFSTAAFAQNGKAAAEQPASPMPAKDIFVKYDAVKVCDLADWTPKGIEIEGSSQGFAMHGNIAVQLHDKGQFVVVDIKARKVLSAFTVDGDESHNNNCNFGSLKAYPGAALPVLYVSECRGDRSCYVVDMDQDGGKIIQTIRYADSDCKGGLDWAVDAENGFIYACYGDGPHLPRTIIKFRLPSLDEGDATSCVEFRRADILDQIELTTIDIAQGMKISGGKAYLTDGAPSTGRMGLHVIDLKSHREEAYLDLGKLGMEPEGLDVAGENIWVAFHVKGKPRNTNIYKIKIIR